MFTEVSSRFARGLVIGSISLLAWACSVTQAATTQTTDGIELELSPRVCTLTTNDQTCDTVVTAQWRASKDESLCLLIVDQPQVKQCWEDHSSGVYSVRLTFTRDLLVELRDLQLQKVLVSKSIAVIREAIRLRHKRRQPWDILS